MSDKKKEAGVVAGEESVDTRERILYAAKREFAENGFNGARMGAISMRANANQALIHYYFGNKENLYMVVLQRLFGVDDTDMVQEFLSRWTFTPPEGLYMAIYILVNVHREAFDPDFMKIIAREIADGKSNFTTLLNDFLFPRLALLEEVIHEGIKTGDFETRSPLLAVYNLVMLVMNYESDRDHFKGSSWYDRLYGKNGDKEFFLFVLEHTFKGLCPRGKDVEIPTIDREILENLDELIRKIKDSHKWVMEDMDEE